MHRYLQGVAVIGNIKSITDKVANSMLGVTGCKDKLRAKLSPEGPQTSG